MEGIVFFLSGSKVEVVQPFQLFFDIKGRMKTARSKDLHLKTGHMMAYFQSEGTEPVDRLLLMIVRRIDKRPIKASPIH